MLNPFFKFVFIKLFKYLSPLSRLEQIGSWWRTTTLFPDKESPSLPERNGSLESTNWPEVITLFRRYLLTFLRFILLTFLNVSYCVFKTFITHVLQTWITHVLQTLITNVFKTFITEVLKTLITDVFQTSTRTLLLRYVSPLYTLYNQAKLRVVSSCI